MSERIKTGLIILGIYLVFILYLFCVSYRFEKLELGSTDSNSAVVEKVNK